jgi:hypothetical protein
MEVKQDAFSTGITFWEFSSKTRLEVTVKTPLYII